MQQHRIALNSNRNAVYQECVPESGSGLLCIKRKLPIGNAAERYNLRSTAQGGEYMKPFGTFAIILLLIISPYIAAQNADPVPVDFRELFRNFRYPGLTALEQQALVGKRYSGEMRVHSVEHDDAKGTVRLNCRLTIIKSSPPAEPEVLYAGIASFQMNDNDAEKAASLKQGYQVRLTGRLARIYKPDPNDIRGRTEFVDATLDDVIFP